MIVVFALVDKVVMRLIAIKIVLVNVLAMLLRITAVFVLVVRVVMRLTVIEIVPVNVLG